MNVNRSSAHGSDTMNLLHSECMKEDVTNNEILEFLQEHMVIHQELQEGLQGVKTELRSEIQGVKTELRSEIQRTKLDFIDKLDEKLGDLKGDLVVLMRKEDRKLTALVDVLRKKEVLTDDEATSVLALEPFPR